MTRRLSRPHWRRRERRRDSGACQVRDLRHVSRPVVRARHRSRGSSHAGRLLVARHPNGRVNAATCQRAWSPIRPRPPHPSAQVLTDAEVAEIAPGSTATQADHG